MKRHRQDCEVWTSRDKSAVQKVRTEVTFTEKYGEGVTNARHISEAEERRKATMQERYGAENVFLKGSTLFDQVQASLEGKRPVLRGADNPFAKPEVREKIREHWQREHGVSNPQQVPEVREKTRATNLGRYGGELLGSPELAAKVRATNEARYGDVFPQRTDKVKARIQETNEARYGVPWTSMDPEVRAKQLATMEAKYGSHFFASEEGKGIVRAAMLEKYGVEFWMQTEGAWDKLVETFRERFGVDHPLQDSEILAKRESTNRQRYGWDNFIGSPDFVVACLQSYGVPIPAELPDHPMRVREFARKHFDRMGPGCPGPNKLEQRVWDMAPLLMFTGDRKFWRWLPKLGHFKNPDFILPGPDQEHPFRGVTKIVEVFGDYWHGRMRTGKAGFEHEQGLIDAFADIGFECLVIWESQVKAVPEAVMDRLLTFLGD